jgi:L-malate glycosyltransferase
MVDDIKNISGLIASFGQAVKENNLLHLTLVGGGPDLEKMKLLVTKHMLHSNITLKGRLEHSAVLNEMQRCHFYVCNSNFETFGMTVAEALRAGKPVISTKCGGPEEFLNSANSISVEPKNNEQLKTAILKMAVDYQNYDAGKLAHEIENRFGKNAVKEKLVTFYQNCIK